MEMFRKAFQGNYNKLVQEMDVDSGLWTALKSRNVLTPEHIRDCTSYVCHCAKYSHISSMDISVLYDINCKNVEFYNIV